MVGIMIAISWLTFDSNPRYFQICFVKTRFLMPNSIKSPDYSNADQVLIQDQVQFV